MAKQSLTATPLSNNDIRVLARLLQYEYALCFAGEDPPRDYYLRDLMTLVGLGFTAIIEDGAYVLTFQANFNHFLDYFWRSQKDSPSSIEHSLIAAQIIAVAPPLFAHLGYPDYTLAFETTLKKVLGSSKGSSQQREEGDRLIHLMTRKSSP